MDTSAALGSRMQQLVADVSEVAALLWERGWAERNAGNISVDVTDCTRRHGTDAERLAPAVLNLSYPELAGRSFLVSRSGARMRDLAKSAIASMALLRISDDGRSYRTLLQGNGGRPIRPTSEFAIHLRVHQSLRSRKAAQTAVVHTHPTELIALTQAKEYCQQAMVNDVLWGMHPEVKVFIPEGAGLVPYLRPTSEELAEATAGALAGHRTVVWAKHGALAVGQGVAEAFDLIDTLNKAARIFLMCRSAGLDPTGLTAAQLDELKEVESFFKSLGDFG